MHNPLKRLRHGLRRFAACLPLLAGGLAAGPALAAPPVFQAKDDTAVTAEKLVQTLLSADAGLVISNISFTGDNRMAGTFSGGETLEFSDGIVLGTGDVNDIPEAATSQASTDVTYSCQNGDADLDEIIPQRVCESVVLEFDFVPQGDTVSFRYRLASDEYPEFIDDPFNDAFAFFLNGVNYALLPDGETPVAIKSVNNLENSAYYVHNNPDETGEGYYNGASGDAGIEVVFDGLTTVLSFEAPVKRGEVNHIKLVVGDVEDNIYDSAVFLEGGSFTAKACTGTRAVGIDPQGQGFEPETCFSGDLSTDAGQSGNDLIAAQDETVIADGTLEVAAAHQGQPAEVVLWITYQRQGQEKVLMRGGANWTPWDGQWATLQAAYSVDSLPEVLNVQLLQSMLPGFPGEFTLHTGYRLADGTLVYNGNNPLHFFVANSGGGAGSGAYFEATLGQSGCGPASQPHVKQEDSLDIRAVLRAAAPHVGRNAAVIMAAQRQRAGLPPAFSGDWQAWADTPDGIAPAQSGVTLPATLDLPVFQGRLGGLPGAYTLHLGYRLDDGTLVLNNLDPLRFRVANSLQVSETTPDWPQSCAYFAGALLTAGGQSGPQLLAGQEDRVTVDALLYPDPAHLGRIADLIMLVVYERQGGDRLYRLFSQDWQYWASDFPPLQATQAGVVLSEGLPFRFAVPTENPPGGYTVYLAYRLQDGTLVFNGLEPLKLQVR